MRHSLKSLPRSTRWPEKAKCFPSSTNPPTYSSSKRHTSIGQRTKFLYSFCTFHWSHSTTWCLSTNSCRCRYISFSLAKFPITPEVGVNNMIAVEHSKWYQTLSSLDLQNCIKLGETYCCKGRNVLHTDLSKTCIGSLYLASPNKILWSCKFSIGDVQEKIFGQQHICGVLPWDHQHQPHLSSS